MNDFSPHKFLTTKGILGRILGRGLVSLILFAMLAAFAAMVKAWYGVAILAS